MLFEEEEETAREVGIKTNSLDSCCCFDNDNNVEENCFCFCCCEREETINGDFSNVFSASFDDDCKEEEEEKINESFPERGEEVRSNTSPENDEA